MASSSSVIGGKRRHCGEGPRPSRIGTRAVVTGRRAPPPHCPDLICGRRRKMGMCLPCLGGAAEDVIETPDPVGPIISRGPVLEDFPETPLPELKRRQLAEAAEKRQMETVNRGIKNPTSVEQKKRKKEEVEKMTTEAAPPSGGAGGGLRWQVG